MRDGADRHTAITYIQPTMLKTIAGAAAVWGVGLPVVLAIKLGDLRLLLLAPLGLLLVPAIIVLAMFGRLLLWLHLVLFWYVRGVIAAISLLAFAGLSCAILTMPMPWLDQIGATFTAGLPTNVLAVGAIIGSVASAGVAAVWMIRQRARRGSEGGSLSRTPNIPLGESGPPAPPLKPPTEAPRPLTYLEHRKPK